MNVVKELDFLLKSLKFFFFLILLLFFWLYFVVVGICLNKLKREREAKQTRDTKTTKRGRQWGKLRNTQPKDTKLCGIQELKLKTNLPV